MFIDNLINDIIEYAILSIPIGIGIFYLILVLYTIYSIISEIRYAKRCDAQRDEDIARQEYIRTHPEELQKYLDNKLAEFRAREIEKNAVYDYSDDDYSENDVNRYSNNNYDDDDENDGNHYSNNNFDDDEYDDDDMNIYEKAIVEPYSPEVLFHPAHDYITGEVFRHPDLDPESDEYDPPTWD